MTTEGKSQKTVKKIRYNQTGFSLLELQAALVIGALVLIAAVGLYNQLRANVDKLEQKLAGGDLGGEILQRIAEDLDRMICPIPTSQTTQTQISIKNKNDNGYHSAQLVITRNYYDNYGKEQILEQVIWQSGYDYDSNSLVLYRSRSGLSDEDLLLDAEKDDWEKELFVPVASGLSYFAVEIPQADKLLSKWSDKSLPKAIVITLSFAEPFKSISGTFDVLDTDKLSRIITLQKARKIQFVHTSFDPNMAMMMLSDINDMNMPDLDIFDMNTIDMNMMDINGL